MVGASTSGGSFQVGISTATRHGLSRTGRALGPAWTSQREKVYRPSPTAACNSSTYSGIDSHHTARSTVATARQTRYAAVTISARTATARGNQVADPGTIRGSAIGKPGQPRLHLGQPNYIALVHHADPFVCELASQVQIGSHRPGLTPSRAARRTRQAEAPTPNDLSPH